MRRRRRRRRRESYTLALDDDPLTDMQFSWEKGGKKNKSLRRVGAGAQMFTHQSIALFKASVLKKKRKNSISRPIDAVQSRQTNSSIEEEK